jgi:hypothetical protein
MPPDDVHSAKAIAAAQWWNSMQRRTPRLSDRRVPVLTGVVSAGLFCRLPVWRSADMAPDFRAASSTAAAVLHGWTETEKSAANGRRHEKASDAAQNATDTYSIRSVSAAHPAVSAEQARAGSS